MATYPDAHDASCNPLTYSSYPSVSWHRHHHPYTSRIQFVVVSVLHHAPVRFSGYPVYKNTSSSRFLYSSRSHIIICTRHPSPSRSLPSHRIITLWSIVIDYHTVDCNTSTQNRADMFLAASRTLLRPHVPASSSKYTKSSKFITSFSSMGCLCRRCIIPVTTPFH